MNPSTRSVTGTAVVTGASSGIGATYADRLARRGHDLLLVARRADKLDALAARLRETHGVRVETLAADLTDAAALARVEQRLRDDTSITLLVNNAGTATMAPVGSGDIEALQREILLNVLAPTRLAHAAVAGLRARGRGGVIEIASVMSQMVQPGNSVYGATKAYLLFHGQVMAQELADSGVRVQVVLPGATRTEIWDHMAGGVDALPPGMVMEVDDLVDAALAGWDAGEVVTIPSLPDAADWQRLVDARDALRPNLSRDQPAARYRG